jgi:hypothetical protein
MGQQLSDERAAKKKTPVDDSLKEPLPTSRPLGCTVEQAELEDLFQKVIRGTPWFAFTYRNVDL